MLLPEIILILQILQHLLHQVQVVAQFQVTKATISVMMRTTMLELDAIGMAVIVVVTSTIPSTYCDACECLDPSQLGGCGVPKYKGDNFCDDENNNVGCDYDGGDCCGKINDTYCNICQCLDPSFQCQYSDNYSNCPNWAASGYCTLQIYANWMNSNCKKSCTC